MNKENISIKENSWIAWLAAKKLHTKQVAIVIGKTVHLHNTSKSEFLANERWVRHEQKHIEQFSQHGFFTFIGKYLFESLKKGYYQNKYEVEARAAELENE